MQNSGSNSKVPVFSIQDLSSNADNKYSGAFQIGRQSIKHVEHHTGLLSTPQFSSAGMPGCMCPTPAGFILNTG